MSHAYQNTSENSKISRLLWFNFSSSAFEFHMVTHWWDFQWIAFLCISIKSEYAFVRLLFVIYSMDQKWLLSCCSYCFDEKNLYDSRVSMLSERKSVNLFFVRCYIVICHNLNWRKRKKQQQQRFLPKSKHKKRIVNYKRIVGALAFKHEQWWRKSGWFLWIRSIWFCGCVALRSHTLPSLPLLLNRHNL